MYEKCLTCTKLGISCDGPNFMAMNTTDLISWCNARRKQLPGMTYDRIVENTGLSKGTISGFFSGSHADYRIDTIRPILQMLVGGEWDDNPCADPSTSERAAYEERIRQLEAAVEWRDDKIQHFSNENKRLQEELAGRAERHKHSQDFLRGEMKRKNKVIGILGTFLGLALAVIIAALVIDRLNPNIGFFWLESLLKPHGITNIIDIFTS